MTSDNLQKKCGFCGESIPAGAGRCPYCGSILEVSFDNNYKIGPADAQPSDGSAAGQDNAGCQSQHEHGWPQDGHDSGTAQTGPDAGWNRNAADYETPGDQTGGGSYGTVPAGYGADRQAFNSNRQNTYGPCGSGGYRPGCNYGAGPREPLSNGLKVFLTVLFTILPGIGQLAGIIAAIVFMNSDGDNDRKSFGVALLVASLIMFVISCISCFILVMAFSSSRMNY